jgi:hypothetical protein
MNYSNSICSIFAKIWTIIEYMSNFFNNLTDVEFFLVFFEFRFSGLEKSKDRTNCEAALRNESKLKLLNPKPFNLNVLVSPLCETNQN